MADHDKFEELVCLRVGSRPSEQEIVTMIAGWMVAA